MFFRACSILYSPATVLIFLWGPALASSVMLTPSSARPGQTVKVEREDFNRLEPLVVCDGKRSSPLYPVESQRLRALLPVPQNAQPGEWTLTITEKTACGKPPTDAPPHLETITIPITTHRFGKESIRFPKEKQRLLNNPIEDKEGRAIVAALSQATQDAEQRWTGLFEKPVPGRLISRFGLTRSRAGQKKTDFHRGVDLEAKRGDPVAAPNGGRVLLVKDYDFHGKTIVLSHGQGVGSLYIHLDRIEVKKGQVVEKGEIIGRAGSSGLSTAPHLHWGLYIHGRPVDPEQWLEQEF